MATGIPMFISFL